MYVAQPLPESVVLEVPDGSCILQLIEYEWRPEYCQECFQIGKHKKNYKAQTKTHSGTNDKQQPMRPQKKAKQQQWKAKPNAELPAEAAEQTNDVPKENHKEMKVIEKGQQTQRIGNDRGKQEMEEKKDTKSRTSLVTEYVEQFLQQNRFSVLTIQPKKANTSRVKGDTVNKDPT